MLDDSSNGQFNTVLVATRRRLCRDEEIGFDIAEEIRCLGKCLVVVDEVPMPPVRLVEAAAEESGRGSGNRSSARGSGAAPNGRRNGRIRGLISKAEGGEQGAIGKADGKRGREAVRGRKSSAADSGRRQGGAGGSQSDGKPFRAQSGPAPFGYVRERIGGRRGQSQLRPDPQEADAVRVIFREYLRRRSMKKLIDYLQRENVSTRRGRLWSRAAIAWILKNDTYLGKVHAGGHRFRGAHQPIIAPIIFNKVQQLLLRNNKRRDRGNQAPVVVANTKKAAVAGRKASTSGRQPSSNRQPAMAGAAG
jgi:hypothetical protein